jgi:protein SCO1/2
MDNHTRSDIRARQHVEEAVPRKTLVIGLAGLAVLIAITAFLYLGRSNALSGSVMNPPWPAPEISLVDHNGTTFSLSAQRGSVVLIYFGYVNCPDECPLTMAHLKLARENLGKQGDRMQVIMVSTDPPRDTPTALKAFLGKFDPSFLGLTGTPEQLQRVWKAFGVAVENGGETHSTFIYLVDPSGDIRETFLPDADPATIATDVAVLLRASGR